MEPASTDGIVWTKHEFAVVVLKPHVCLDFYGRQNEIRREVEEILTLKLSLKVLEKAGCIFSLDQALAFYAEHMGKPFFDQLIGATISGPCIFFIVRGENAIKKIRDLIGPTDPRKGEEHHLRHIYGRHESGPYNAIHCSDSMSSFLREAFILTGKTWLSYDLNVC